MAVKGAKNITQFKILEWVEKNFHPGCVTVQFDHADRATVTDQEGGLLMVGYTPVEGITWVSKERREDLDREWDECVFLDDEEYREWYDGLTTAEKAQIDAWDKQYAKGMTRLCEAILEQEKKEPLASQIARVKAQQKAQGLDQPKRPLNRDRELEL